METIPAKTILSGYADTAWFGANYNMNLYKGCCHGCIYCDSRSSCYRVERFDTVRAKENALEILRRELLAKRRSGIVHTGAMSDPYNPFEKEACLTAGALDLLARHGFGAVLATKSDLAVRDAQRLLAVRRHAPAAVNFTVTTADDVLCRAIERCVCPTSARLSAMRALTGAGVPCGVLLMPILPFINDTPENIRAVVRRAADAGASWIYAGPGFGVTLRDNQREYFYDRLDEAFPGLRRRYAETFGLRYACVSPRHKELWALFTAECRAAGLLWRMKDIAARIREGYGPQEQLTLF
jgi:DNA repair photolyase